MAQTWISHALNGNSVRVATGWEPTGPSLLAGPVVERTANTLTIAVEEGSLDGEPLEAGEWRRVRLNRAGVLRKWDKRDKPSVGQKVAIQYFGATGTEAGMRKLFAAGVAGEWD